MDTAEIKKFRKSPVAIVCYVFAAISLCYCIYTLIRVVGEIYAYYAGYGMSPGLGEVIGYVLQSCSTPFVQTVTMFMAGYILEAVRKLDPANWATEEEIAERKEAKRLAKEAKQIAKGEAAAAAAAAEAESAGEDDTDAIKEEFSAVVAEEAENNVVYEEVEEEPAEEVQEAAEETTEEAAEETEKETEEETAEHTEFFAEVAEPAEEEAEEQQL